MIARLVPPNAAVPPGWRATRLALASAFAGIAIAGPRWGVERTVVRGEGVDIVLAVDASLSMMATDERPNRLEKVKQEIRRLRAASPSDRFALLAFAGRSYILTPLTVDDAALDLFLDNLDPSVVRDHQFHFSRGHSLAPFGRERTCSSRPRAAAIMRSSFSVTARHSSRRRMSSLRRSRRPKPVSASSLLVSGRPPARPSPFAKATRSSRSATRKATS